MKDLTRLNDEPRKSAKHSDFGTKLRFTATDEFCRRLERLQKVYERLGEPTSLSHVFDHCLASRETELGAQGLLPPLD